MHIQQTMHIQHLKLTETKEWKYDQRVKNESSPSGLIFRSSNHWGLLWKWGAPLTPTAGRPEAEAVQTTHEVSRGRSIQGTVYEAFTCYLQTRRGSGTGWKKQHF